MVRKDEVADVRPADRQVRHVHGVLMPHSDFYLLEVRVHGSIHASDGPLHYGAVLEFHRHRLVHHFHQKPGEFHGCAA
eukprot:CAMPEP_0170613200 /NCGR_PEP_ID=MMETSP0224-20130122/24144_1 /TAXON_ID=285029 /ORGANISM="Togula jolla, Strain CCCM 725" /LENGTH=77 /DNA_ID=CAMNT_0010938783 /DNA_START=196 /DNA_END=429 /DNA_ORIENTATION=-